MKSGIVVLSSMLALSACSCSRTVKEDRPAAAAGSGVPRSRTVGRSQAHFDRNAGRQVQLARWARDGMWTPVHASGGDAAVLYASDHFGARIVSLDYPKGYEVREARLDCRRQTVGYLDSRASASDAALPSLSAKAGPLSFGIPPAEVRRLCALGRSGTLGGGHLLAVVRDLRAGSAKVHASSPDLRTEAVRPKEPSKDDRARMWAEYQKQHAPR